MLTPLHRCLDTPRPQAAPGGETYRPGQPILPGLYACARLGAGRRCEAWLVWAVTRWAAVVLKLPRPDRAADERTRRALAREAAILASLAHPAVQRLLEAHADAPRPYLLFEYVEGPTLDQVLRTEGPMPVGDLLRLGMQIAGALHYLHQQGLVHLDLKPGNVALRDGRVVLLDFELARRVGEAAERPRPRGTPPFMAPEQIRGEAASPAMDLFALGVTLYQAATGFLPFHPAREGREYTFPQLNAAPLPPRALRPDLPREVEAAVLGLLDPDPRRRPATALATLALLGQALPPGEEATWPAWADRLLPGPSDCAPHRDLP
ncbi:MAG: serine/threonine-protein kinase [Armatimonadota bacterium]|nr:serine/threonine-protein kinase [Armatimonadota bacterium]